MVLARIKEIITDSDLSLSIFVLGLGMMAWGLVGYYMGQQDLKAFAEVLNSMSWKYWLFNYEFVGGAFVYLAIKKFPTKLTLLIASYGVVIWIWIITVRSSSSPQGGIVLNAVVILFCILMLQRSNIKHQ